MRTYVSIQCVDRSTAPAVFAETWCYATFESVAAADAFAAAHGYGRDVKDHRIVMSCIGGTVDEELPKRAAFVTRAAAAGALEVKVRVVEQVGRLVECEAKFPKARQAAEFAERIAGPGWRVADGTLKRTGLIVTWTGVAPNRAEYLEDMRGTVGYFGSAPQGRKATLNGWACPASM